MPQGKPNQKSREVARGKVLTSGLVLGRARLLLGVEIDFRETPSVRQHKGFGGIVAIDINGFRSLVSNANPIMVLGPGYRDLCRHLYVAFGPKSLYLAVGNISNQGAFFVKGLQSG